jgi:hypothetical protein
MWIAAGASLKVIACGPDTHLLSPFLIAMAIYCQATRIGSPMPSTPWPLKPASVT